MARALKIEDNARPKQERRMDEGKNTVVGLGRDRSWREMLALYETQPHYPLLRGTCHE